MSTQSNTMPESSVHTDVLTQAASATHPFYWSLRRELWENRYVYIAPLAAAVVILLVFAGDMARVHQSSTRSRPSTPNAATAASFSGNLCRCPTSALCFQKPASRS